MNQDLRWIQRFDNFRRAMGTLAEAATLAAARVADEILSRFHPAFDAFAADFARRAAEEGDGACPTA